MIRVAVIDDHPLFRAGVVQTLETESDIQVVGEGSSTLHALQLAEDAKPDVMILDVSMPGGGIDAVEQLGVRSPTVKALMLSGVATAEQIRAAMQKGACGYVLKGVSGPELVEALRVIHAGGRYVAPALAARLFAVAPARDAIVSPAASAGLTIREKQILKLISLGLSNKEIGGQLRISEKTVKHYVTIILDKLGVSTRVQAALLGRRDGIVGE
jgi:two-component system nitrate/nitrite response regulator NarL